jgi:hypothetical protein
MAFPGPDNPVQALLTQRPNAFRFRMGNQKDGPGKMYTSPINLSCCRGGAMPYPQGASMSWKAAGALAKVARRPVAR